MIERITFLWRDCRKRFSGAFQKDDGIRIDHILLSPEAADMLKGSGIDRAVRATEKPSDHVPVWVELEG